MTVVVAFETDRELWARAQARDAAAFAELFERHARSVYNFCFRRTADWAGAEDAMSEVFLVAWKRLPEVVFASEGDEILPWLYGVALNVLRNRQRSGRRAAAALARLDAGEHTDDFADDVVGRLADEAQMKAILSVVDRLAPHEQDVLALCAWAGLSYEGGAVALGVPVGTVRSRLSRARAHLRELVGASGHELGDERIARAGDDRG